MPIQNTNNGIIQFSTRLNGWIKLAFPSEDKINTLLFMSEGVKGKRGNS